jgi:hypothetical protein
VTAWFQGDVRRDGRGCYGARVAKITARPWLEAVSIALTAIAAHAFAIGGEFLWLDHAHIEERLALASPAQWPGLFARGFAGTGYYRPLMALSLSLDAVAGGSPWLFHVDSLLWHAAAAVMVFVAALSLQLPRPAALIAGLLFAVHPATSLVADAIAFRSEAMIVVALLAMLVLQRRGCTRLAALAWLAGALSKETALVVGPLMIAAGELGWIDNAPAGGWRARLRRLAPFAVAAAVALGLRVAFAPAWRATNVVLSPSAAVGTRLASLGKSALLVLLPADRTICDAFAVQPVFSLAALGGAAVLVALGYLGWRRRGPALLLALTTLPLLQLVPVMRWWSPHYVYLPLAFVAMLVGSAVVAGGRAGQVIAAVVLIGAGALSFWDARRFGSDATLWPPELEAQPACREAHFYVGEVARQRHQLDTAAAHYENAIAETPGIISYVDRGAALQNLGVTRMEQGQATAARAALTSALQLVEAEPTRRRLLHDLAAVELRFGNPAEAARLLAPESARPDAQPESLFLRARALHQLGREQEAAILLRRLSLLPPPAQQR